MEVALLVETDLEVEREFVVVNDFSQLCQTFHLALGVHVSPFQGQLVY